MDLKRGSILEYISQDFINWAKKVVKFLIIYTLGFILLAVSLKYAFPFVIAFIIAILLKPIKNKILSLNKNSKKIKLTNGFVSFLLTITIVILMLSALGAILYEIILQTGKLLEYLTNPSTVEEIINAIDSFVSSILAGLNNLDPSIVEKINEGIMTIVKVISSFATTLGKKMLSLAGSIPGALITVIVTLISTYFFTKEIENIQIGVKNIFSEKGHKLFSTVKDKMNSVFGGYIKAYLLIMLVIAFISSVIFTLARVSYALPLAILTAVLDFLPIIGAGLVYGILAIIMYFSGSKTAAIILLIGYVIVALVRQLLEQNLVASFIGVHPIVMIIGLFIAITPLGFLGMFYFIGAFLLYQTVK